MSDFPAICPYAYAYVFWRKSLLKKEHFFGFNTLKTFDYNAASLIVEDLLEHFSEKIVISQMRTHYSIDERSHFWILEKLVTQFSRNFFIAWLEIAGKRSREISVPSWNEIVKMRERSFPKVAFKYDFDVKESSRCIKYYHLKNEKLSEVINYDCPYQKTIDSTCKK
ncbi:hypothetical protein [Paenibacillus polymyxa]|uniref:hypothetical protein n=1 Tax=Paenibacillus polymyxa TaxID=1406 RepID=UPI000FB11E55|nr:hypothetical protein [Paenibacillus polymyxa]RPE06761.1 hypothetical protein EG487_08255 [Paenibacillus polymyxa]